MEEMKDFFISYARADKRWAEWIAWHLKNAGYSVTIQAWDFHCGESFVGHIQKATSECERTIALFSPEYLKSKFTKIEWEAAIAKDPTGEKGTLIPVMVRDCEMKGLLARLTYVQLTGLDEGQAKQKLLSAIHRERSEPEAPPTLPVDEKPRFPDALPPVWNVPLIRNPNFSGREKLLIDLRNSLTQGQSTALTQQAIHGLGGIGKTQLALEYVYRHANDYDIVWWLTSEESTTLAADYAELASALNLPEKDASEQSVVVQAVRHYLGQNRNWLLIFDNAQDPESLRNYLPQAATGHVLITSRHQSWGKIGESLQVKEWSQQESSDFLLNRTQQSDLATAQSIAEELGDLPLALEQAAAYINETQIHLSNYLELFKSRRRELWDEEKKPIDYPDTVATTWTLSIEQITDQAPVGLALLNFCSYLAPEKIPRSLISQTAEYLPDDLAAPLKDELSLNKGIKTLNHFSLIDAQQESIAIHRLVQQVVQDRLSESDRKLWVRVAVNTVNNVFPSEGYNDVRCWPQCILFLPHAQVVITHTEGLHIAQEETSDLMNNVASFLHGRAEYEEAETLYRHSLKIRETQLGDKHPHVAQSLNNLASLLQTQGKYAEAEKLYRRSLKIKEVQLGNEHPSVATSLNNLASLLEIQSKYTEAEPLYRRALKIYEEQLGDEHLSVAAILNNLASLLLEENRCDEAKPLCHRALKIYETQLGDKHPYVAKSLNNLAKLYQKQNNYEKAEPLFHRALMICETQLGKDHPDTSTVRDNLKRLLEEMKSGQD